MTGPSAGHLVEEEWLGASVRCYPDRVRTIVEALDVAVQRFADRTMLETAEGDVTYAEFAELVEGAVASLTERGVRPGDPVAVALRNGLDIVVAIWACARAGFLFVGLSTRLSAEQWTYMLGHSRARLALAGPEYLEPLQRAAAGTSLPPGSVLPAADVLLGRRLPWRGEVPEQLFPDQDDTYGVIYTSGTTGRPKASLLSHRGTTHSARAYVESLNLVGTDRTAIVFPLYYVTGHVAQVTPMMLVGGTSVTVADFTPRGFCDLIRERRVTYLMVVPNVWQLLLRLPDFEGSSLPHVEIGAFGGSPVPLSTIEALRGRMPQLRLYDAYGLTETHSPATILIDAEFRRKPGSVGRPLPCADVRVVDDSGRDLPTGQAGELWIRGPMITPGYLHDDEATARAITDGWLHTGDLARLDSDGYVYLLDRMKDMIIRGGNKVYSVELEYLLVSHPAISEAAVVGVPDELAHEAVATFVVAAHGQEVTAQEVRRWVRERMADYAVPKVVRVVDAVPRNRTGKVDKAALRRLLTDDGARTLDRTDDGDVA